MSEPNRPTIAAKIDNTAMTVTPVGRTDAVSDDPAIRAWTYGLSDASSLAGSFMLELRLVEGWR